MAFDPDEYLAGKSAEPSVATAPSDGFDPDAYLSSKTEAFDPDAYLAEREAPQAVAPKPDTFADDWTGFVANMQIAGNRLLQSVTAGRLDLIAQTQKSAQLARRAAETGSPEDFDAYAQDRIQELGMAAFPKRDSASISKDAEVLENRWRNESLKIPEFASYLAEKEQRIKQLTPSLSPEMQKFNEAKGAEFWKVFAQNPVEGLANVIASSAVISSPSIAMGAIGSLAGPAGTAAGTGAGSYYVESANAMLDSLQAAGVDLSNKEQVEAAFTDPTVMEKARDFANKRGIPIAIFDAASAGVAGKFIGPLLKEGATATTKQVLAATGKEVLSQMVAGAAGEAAAELVSGQELSGKEIALEALGEIGSAITEGYSNVRARQRIDAELAKTGTTEPPAPPAPTLTQVPPVTQEGIYTAPPEGEGDVFAGITQPVTQDAQTIPSDEAQVSPGGIAEEPSGVPSGENLQQPAPEEPSGTTLPRTEETEFVGTAIDAPEGIVTRETGTSHAELVQEAIEKGAPFDKTLEEKQGFAFRKPDGSIEWVDRIEAGKRLVAMGLLKGFTPGDILTSEHIRNEVEGVTFTPKAAKPTQDEAAQAIEPFRDAAIAMAKNQGATDINAEDIFQEVQVELSRQVAEGKTDLSKIGGLVSKAVKNKTANFLQKESRQKRGGGLVESGDIEGPTGETAITEAATTRGPRAESVSQEDIQTIEQAIESLPESERKVMKMTVEGLSDEEISKQTGLTPNAVRQARFRSREKLKEFIRSQGIGERMAPGAANEKEFQRARYIAGTDIYLGLESAGQLSRETWERQMERIYEDAFTPEQLDDAWRTVQIAAQESKETRKPIPSIISQMMGVEQGKEGITALKNAQADLERRKRGLPAAFDPARRTQVSVWDEAMRQMDATDGRFQENVLDKLRADPRSTLNDVEIMALLHAKITAENLFDTRVQEVNSAKDKNAQLVAIEKAREAEASLIEIYDLSKQVGSEQGRSFAARKMLVSRDYSIPRLTAELRAAQLGEELTTEQKELVKTISENVERTESELDARTTELEEEQSRQEFEKAVSEFQDTSEITPRILAIAKRIVERWDAAAERARERLRGKFASLGSAPNPTILYDLAIIGASKIAHGLYGIAWKISMRNEFGDKINPYLDDIYKKSDEMIENSENEVLIEDRPKVRKAVRKTDAQDVLQSTTAELKSRTENGESLRDMRIQVQKMALELVRSGVTTPDGLLDAMHAILEPIQPGIGRRQVMDLISGYGDLKALDMESAKVTLRDLKGQYQQLAKLEDIQGGLEPAKTGIERRKPSMSEKELIRRVNEARQKFGVGTLEAYKARLQNQIADLELRIKRKDFRKKIRKVVDISKDAEAVRLLAENERWKRKFAEARYEAKKSAEKGFQKAQRYGKEALNIPRAVKSSLDFSAVLRQGGFISLGNPVRAAKNLLPMFKAAVSQEQFEKSEAEIRNRQNANLYKQSKLYLASMDGDLSNREEAFRSEFSDKIPGVKGSNRAYIGFLNRMRADTFDALVGSLPHTPTPEQLQAIAHYINVATGRGDLGAHGSAAETLSTVLWSPRLLISRIQLLAAEPMARRNAAGVRKVIAKEYAKALTGAAIVIGLGLAAGADVEDDPRSSDFGKLKFGNTRVDPWMGLQQITTLSTRMGASLLEAMGFKTPGMKTQKGKVYSLRVKEGEKRGPYDETTREVASRFLQTKLTPILGSFFDVTSGETVVGQKAEPFSFKKTFPWVPEIISPLSFDELVPLMEEQGVPKGVALQILNLFGMSVQHQEQKN